MLTPRCFLWCGILLTVACGPADSRDADPAQVPAPATAPPEASGAADGASPRVPTAEAGGDEREPPAIVFLGTSLTAGLGVRSDQAYPARIQERVDALGLELQVVNAGVSGDTSAGGLRRIDWLLQQPIEVLVIELGANDMLRGQDLEALERNLQQIIDRTRERHPSVRIVIAGMQAAPNLGPEYGPAFAQVFERVAERNAAELIPFLLDGVAADPRLNQADGIHPTAAGHERIAETVWSTLRPVIEEALGGPDEPRG